MKLFMIIIDYSINVVIFCLTKPITVAWHQGREPRFFILPNCHA